GGPGGATTAWPVGGVHRVQPDATPAQVTRPEPRRRGFNFVVSGTQASFGSIGLGGITASTGSGTTAAAAGNGVGVSASLAGASPVIGPSGANIVLGIVPAGFAGFLQALPVHGLAHPLAEPKLTATSGRPANFLSGGRQAILSPSSGINGP